MKTKIKTKIRAALLIDEFFGGFGTAFGGYGFLARKYIAKYVPCEQIEMDVILRRGKKYFSVQSATVDGVTLYKTPRIPWCTSRWLEKQDYDIYLSVDMTGHSAKIFDLERNLGKKLILWIQDPRPKSAWENTIATMSSIQDPCFYTERVPRLVHRAIAEKRLILISQGHSLNPLAQELFELETMPPVRYFPNPVDIDFDFDLSAQKKENNIIFLGRLEAQKRVWLVCEVAKRMPQYDFYIIGDFFRYREENERMLKKYMGGGIPNLHFVGHKDAEEKRELIKRSKVLLNTSIWEGIPISWLEALACGTVLVSNCNNERLPERFGAWTGDVLGDGFDQVDRYIPHLEKLMEDDALRNRIAREAISYVREHHGIEKFTRDMRELLLASANERAHEA